MIILNLLQIIWYIKTKIKRDIVLGMWYPSFVIHHLFHFELKENYPQKHAQNCKHKYFIEDKLFKSWSVDFSAYLLGTWSPLLMKAINLKLEHIFCWND